MFMLNRVAAMSTRNYVPPQALLPATAPGERSPSPFAVSDQTKPHTSITNLPGLPTPVKSTAQRRRREIQELRSKVELLGTKVSQSREEGGDM